VSGPKLAKEIIAEKRPRVASRDETMPLTAGL
jgi:hypothetical protein